MNELEAVCDSEEEEEHPPAAKIEDINDNNIHMSIEVAYFNYTFTDSIVNLNHTPPSEHPNVLYLCLGLHSHKI